MKKKEKFCWPGTKQHSTTQQSPNPIQRRCKETQNITNWNKRNLVHLGSFLLVVDATIKIRYNQTVEKLFLSWKGGVVGVKNVEQKIKMKNKAVARIQVQWIQLLGHFYEVLIPLYSFLALCHFISIIRIGTFSKTNALMIQEYSTWQQEMHFKNARESRWKWDKEKFDFERETIHSGTI